MLGSAPTSPTHARVYRIGIRNRHTVNEREAVTGTSPLAKDLADECST